MDRKQARAFEGFVTESGDALLRMATLLTADPDAAEDVYQETLHRRRQRHRWLRNRALTVAVQGARGHVRGASR